VPALSLPPQLPVPSSLSKAVTMISTESWALRITNTWATLPNTENHTVLKPSSNWDNQTGLPKMIKLMLTTLIQTLPVLADTTSCPTTTLLSLRTWKDTMSTLTTCSDNQHPSPSWTNPARMSTSIGLTQKVTNSTNTMFYNTVNHTPKKHTSVTNGKCITHNPELSWWSSKLQLTTSIQLDQHQPQPQPQPQHQVVEVEVEEAPLQELLANQLIGKPEVWLPESKINNNVVDAGPSPLLDVSDPEELLLDTHSLITLSNNLLIALDHMETMVAVVESWNLLSNTLR